MLSAKDLEDRFDNPENETGMVVWKVPPALRFPPIPEKIYCNKLLKPKLEVAFQNILIRKLQSHFHTWDGCFNIRKKRGGTSYSLHSWGAAIDINASENAFGKKPTISKELVACFTDAGLDWGGEWGKPDGMHFQIRAEDVK